jgi:hypothetical protein
MQDWDTGGSGETELGVVDVQHIARGRFEIDCSQCGRLSGDYGSEDEAQQAARQHMLEYHAPGWTIIAV